MGEAASVRVFYRLIESDTPTERDFWTHARLGRPLRDERDREFYERGVSAFDRSESAIEMAKKIRNPVMKCFAKLVIPPGCQLRIEKTRGRNHYTIWDADPLELLGYVEYPTIPVQEGAY